MARPAEILSWKNFSFLDTIFVSKATKRPSWLTATSGSITTVLSVSTTGRLKEEATIQWSPETSSTQSKPEITVKIGDDEHPAESFGRKSGSVFSNKSVVRFMIHNLHCQWSETRDRGGAGVPWTMEVLEWECRADAATDQPAQPSSSKLKSLFRFTSTPKEPELLLAKYRSPVGLMRGDHRMEIYDEGIPYIFQLLLSAILRNSKRDEWRKVQTKASLQELETMLSSEVAVTLPANSAPLQDSTVDPEL